MPHIFADSPGKRAVREKWNTPLLSHLHNAYGFTYRYFGLPGPEIKDILLWREMISEVVAFEVPATGNLNERTHINKLRTNLELLDIPNTTYYGAFEHVVLLGQDYDGQKYEQKEVITLYNLDFCGEIGSKILTQDARECYRVDAIRQIVRDQAACFIKKQKPTCFIIFITVRNQMTSHSMMDRIGSCRQISGEYISTCETVKPISGSGHLIGTHAWAIKTILHTAFQESLRGNNINVMFFPLLKYTGSPVRTGKALLPSPMLHLMLFCNFQNPRATTGICVPHNPLLVKSIEVNTHYDLAISPEPGETNDITLSPIEFFEMNKTSLLAGRECLVS